MESSDVMGSMGVVTRAALIAWMTIRPNDDGGEDGDGVKVMCPPHRTGRTIGIQCVSDDNEYGDSHFTGGDTKKIRCYAEEIVHHERSTIQVKPDGTVSIIPHPRQLPNEILACIIDYVAEPAHPHGCKFNSRELAQQIDLYTCTLVNKQFNSVANRVLWQEPILDIGPVHMQQLLDCLAATEQPMGQYIRRLVLLDNTCDSSRLLRPVTHRSDLQGFFIGNEDFSNEVSPIASGSLEHLPRRCPRLFTPEPNYYQTLGDISCAIAHYCHHLTELYVACGYDIVTSANIFQRNIKKMDSTMVLWPHLKILRLSHAFDIDSTSFIYFIERHPHLELIYLVGAHLMDASLDAMTVFLPNLCKLFLDDASEISPGGMHRLIQHCQKLMLVEFGRCKFVASDHLEMHNDHWHRLILKENNITKIRDALGTGNVH
ncbi:hypothetical protein BCR42DRAFT_495914 [Absidia repens]|uniref:Uncharacterized protein n=1 Tax=Absidia repens TaxID=90262 RepID=A0A1X2I1A8_9FUNG|nr:hypothetical protein BCR42DRAFT_495914 [Absidia repens]